MLRRLHRDVIGNSRRRIGPEIRRDLLGRAQADIDVGGDGVGVEPELRRARAIDGGVERRRVDLLLEMRVGDARDRGDAPPQLLRHAQVGRAVIADGAHVDLRGQAEIEDLRDDVGRLEIEHDLRKRGRQHLAQLAHVVGGRRVALLERHQDHAVIDADGRAVGECQIVGARRQADIVDDQLALALRERSRGSCPRPPGRCARSPRSGFRPARGRGAGSGRRRSRKEVAADEASAWRRRARAPARRRPER